jgi:hypothetical protein
MLEGENRGTDGCFRAAVDRHVFWAKDRTRLGKHSSVPRFSHTIRVAEVRRRDKSALAAANVGDAGSNQYSFTAVLSPDGKSLTQGRWVEGASGTWSATLKAGAQTKR